jgi:hypothetical protein
MPFAHTTTGGGVPFELLLLAGAFLVLGVVFFVQRSVKPFVSLALIATGIAVGTGSFALSDAGEGASHDHPVVSSGSTDGVGRAPADELAQEEAPATPEPGVWDLPVGGFAVALVIAALVGAVGGFVYAGIMGPLRRDERGPPEEE